MGSPWHQAWLEVAGESPHSLQSACARCCVCRSSSPLSPQRRRVPRQMWQSWCPGKGRTPSASRWAGSNVDAGWCAQSDKVHRHIKKKIINITIYTCFFLKAHKVTFFNGNSLIPTHNFIQEMTASKRNSMQRKTQRQSFTEIHLQTKKKTYFIPICAVVPATNITLATTTKNLKKSIFVFMCIWPHRHRLESRVIMCASQGCV